jgi:protocatechuate 3,4-dioxygenase, alpha subunit
MIPSPSQTIGPFFHFPQFVRPSLGRMAGADAKGERIQLAVHLLDGDGVPVPDGLIELWQADANGKYEHPEDQQEQDPDPDLCGFGRLPTDADGVCVFETVRPGAAPGIGGDPQAPHIVVTVFARGMLRPLFTRAYFDGDPANETDRVLALVPEARRRTLMAHYDSGTWLFQIHLCGDGETVFFDV